MTAPFSLNGRVALVTGSTTGLGKAMAFALGRSGAAVALNFHSNSSRAETTRKEFQEAGIRCALFQADVTDEGAVALLTRAITMKLGSLDILVLNATPDQPQGTIEEYDWAFYQVMLDFFVKSPFLLTQACLPAMKQRGRGRIITIGSEVFRRGTGNFSAYVAAKGAQAGWTRSMATELAPYGITVNMISPGWIPVERHGKDPEAVKEAYRKTIPIGRWGVPADVAGAALFLASDEASFITGQDIAVNGGVTVG